MVEKQQMKKNLFTLIYVSLILFCNPNAESKNKVETLLKQNALVVDVRTIEEFNSEHFPNAKHIPLNEIENRISEFGDKTKPIILYCRSGNRSGKAKLILEQAGFTNITNAGGLNDMTK
jgi:phage shock protein E